MVSTKPVGVQASKKSPASSDTPPPAPPKSSTAANYGPSSPPAPRSWTNSSHETSHLTTPAAPTGSRRSPATPPPRRQAIAIQPIGRPPPNVTIRGRYQFQTESVRPSVALARAAVGARCAYRGDGRKGEHSMGLGNVGPDAGSGLTVSVAEQLMHLRGTTCCRNTRLSYVISRTSGTEVSTAAVASRSLCSCPCPLAILGR